MTALKGKNTGVSAQVELKISYKIRKAHGGTAGAMFDLSAALGASCRRFISLSPCPPDMILRDAIPNLLSFRNSELFYVFNPHVLQLRWFSSDICFKPFWAIFLRSARDISRGPNQAGLARCLNAVARVKWFPERKEILIMHLHSPNLEDDKVDLVIFVLLPQKS